MNKSNIHSFYSLDHNVILNELEKALDSQTTGARCTGKLMALNSVENRVLSFDLENGEEYVAKFYRPGRWNIDQLAEEHSFVSALVDYEVPVVRAITLRGSNTEIPSLAKTDQGIFFCIYPKMRGRLKDELSEVELKILARFLARLHIIGTQHPLKHRKTLEIDAWLWDSIDDLDRSEEADNPMAQRYLQLADDNAIIIGAAIEGLDKISIHGDCHVGNVLWNELGPFFTDFDDCMTGPPVQDLWMILKDRGEAGEKQRDSFLEAYEEIKPFERESLVAIESLRALRMLHYNAWIARRWDDPSFKRLFPHFGSSEWWREEIQALHECLECLSS